MKYRDIEIKWEEKKKMKKKKSIIDDLFLPFRFFCPLPSPRAEEEDEESRRVKGCVTPRL